MLYYILYFSIYIFIIINKNIKYYININYIFIIQYKNIINIIIYTYFILNNKISIIIKYIIIILLFKIK